MAHGFTDISQQYLAGIDEEIERLQTLKEQVTELLGTSATTAHRKTSRKPSSPAEAKRTLSPEARERIAAAQRKRWAQQKRAAKPAKKAVVKKTARKSSQKIAKKAVPQKKAALATGAKA